REPVAARTRRHQRTQRGAYRLLDHTLDADPVAKAHLELGGMDVDIHVLRGNLDPEIQGRPVARVDRRAISRLGGSDQERVSKRPAVHEKLGAASGWLGVAGALDVPAHAKGAGGVLDRD